MSEENIAGARDTRWEWAAAGIGMAMVAWVMLGPSWLPLQDLPNHVHVLGLDLSLANDDPYLTRPETRSYTYSLTGLIARPLARLTSPLWAIRTLALLGALGIPLGLAWFAQNVGIRRSLAAALSLPLALSWSTKLGFVQFTIAAALAFAALGFAARCCNRKQPKDIALLGTFAALAYMANGLALPILGLGTLTIWLFSSGRLPAFARLAVAAIPVAVFFILDVSRGVLLAVDLHANANIGVTGAFQYRGVPIALAHLFTRSIGVTGPGNAFFYAPLVLSLLAGLVLVHRSRGTASWSPLVAWLPLFFGALSVFFIEHLELSFAMGSRLSLACAAALTLAGARGWQDRARPFRVALVCSALVATTASVTVLYGKAQELHALLGDGPEAVDGLYLTANVQPECHDNSKVRWGDWAASRMVWAYALGPNGRTPYAFAWSRYHPVIYRKELYNTRLHAPGESNDHPGGPPDEKGCEEANLSRLARAIFWPGVDGVLVTGPRDYVRGLLAKKRWPLGRSLAPGLLLVPTVERPPLFYARIFHEWTFRRGWQNGSFMNGMMAADEDIAEISLLADSSRAGTLQFLASATGPPGTTKGTVSVSLNGKHLGDIIVKSKQKKLSLDVPEGIAGPGWNVLQFQVTSATRETSAVIGRAVLHQ